MKKFVSLLLTVVMLLAMAVPAMAEEPVMFTMYVVSNVNPYAISTMALDDEASTPVAVPHTFEVYQIFTGDVEMLGEDQVLVNIKWGVNGTGVAGEAVAEETLQALANVTGSSDTDKLAAIKQYVNMESTPVGTVSEIAALQVVPGYYLLKDVTNLAAGGEYSLYIVKVVGDTAIKPKYDDTTSDKEVFDVNDSTTAEGAWGETADHDIGDAVPFKLTAKITGNYDYYTDYHLTFHDVLSDGLTFNNDAKVYVDGVEITEGYEVVTSELTDGCSFEVRFADLKQIAAVHAGAVITVEYTATLNEKAVIGLPGNPNTMYVEYDNNPNDEGDGEETSGETPEDTVVVFTYELDVDKVNKDLAPLAGATFTLYKQNTDGDWTEIGAVAAAEVTTTSTNEAGEEVTTTAYRAVWTGLDDGIYKISETVTPAGYNTAEDIIFYVTAEHDEVTDKTEYSLNLTVKDAADAEGESEKVTANDEAGKLTTTVVNMPGTKLPSTGGTGTTMIYIAGGVLMLGAVIVLITKKRAEESAE